MFSTHIIEEAVCQTTELNVRLNQKDSVKSGACNYSKLREDVLNLFITNSNLNKREMKKSNMFSKPGGFALH